MDCHEDEELCEEFSILNSKKKIIKIFTENTYDEGIIYKGQMDWKLIAGAAQRKMQNFVSIVNKENYENFVQENPQKNKIVLFTDKKYTIALFKSLSKTYKDKLVFGEIR